MQESFFMPRFVNIKNYKTQNLYADPIQLLDNIDILKNQVQKSTQDCQQQVQEQHYDTRSVKELEQNHDFSFQCEFMDQHQQCFEKSLSKYIESQDNILQTTAHQYFTQQELTHENSIFDDITVKKLLRKSQVQNLLTEQESQRLIIDLRRQKKFNEFLQQILLKVNKNTAIQAIYIANLLWEQYYPIQEHNYSYQETIEFAEMLTTKFIQQVDQKLKLINFAYFKNQSHNQNQEKERLENFTNFFKFLITTFALIINGYFQNPFSNQETSIFKKKDNHPTQSIRQDNDDNWDQDSENQEEGCFTLKKGKKNLF